MPLRAVLGERRAVALTSAPAALHPPNTGRRG